MADPFTLASIANIGVRGIKGILDSRSAAKTARANEEALRMANAQTALSALGNNPRQFTPNLRQAKESRLSSFLGGVGTAIDTATTAKSLLDAGRLASQREALLKSQAKGQDLSNAAAERAEQTAIGAGKFAANNLAGQGIQAAESARRAGNTLSPLNANTLPRTSFLGGNAGTPQQRAIQRLSQPVGGGQAAGFAAGQAAQTALERQAAQTEFDNLLKLTDSQTKALTAQMNAGRVAAADRRAEETFLQKTQEFQMKLDRFGQLSPKDQAGLEDSLRKNFQDLTKDFRTVQSSYSKILEVSKDPSAAGDLSLIFMFMKMLDPGSVVRESEFRTAESTGGWNEAAQNFLGRAWDGERLTMTRDDFLSQAQNLYTAARANLEPVITDYTGIAERRGLDIRNVITSTRDLLAGNKSDTRSNSLTHDASFRPVEQAAPSKLNTAAADLLRQALQVGGADSSRFRLRGLTLGNP